MKKSLRMVLLTLVKWMFTSMSLHPAVSDLASIADKETDASNKAADMFQRLMTVTCKEQVQKAVKFEGTIAIQQGFKVFGEACRTGTIQSSECRQGIGRTGKTRGYG